MRERAKIGMAVSGVALVVVVGVVIVVTLREPRGRFVESSDVVIDRRTGLVWQRVASRARFDWREADAHCRALRIGGQPARLPTRDELRSLVDERRVAPVIDPALAGTEPVWYWTSTAFPGTTRFVWAIGFEHGGMHYLHRASRWPARCVGRAPSPDEPRPEERSTEVAIAPSLRANAIVRGAEVEDDRITLRVGLRDGSPVPATRSGQTVILGLPLSHRRTKHARDPAFRAEPGSVVRRRYTITSPPSSRDTLEVTVKLRPDGVLSPRLLTLREGDVLWMGTRYGATSLRDTFGDDDVVLVGSGVGIAHFIAYLRGDFECNGTRKVMLLHGATQPDELWYREELEALAARCRNFTYVPTLLRRPDVRNGDANVWSGRIGAIEDLWGGGVVGSLWGAPARPDRVHVAMCANLTLVDRMSALLERDGFRAMVRGARPDFSWCEVD